ncbi:cytochrome C biogenesis protein [Fulvivirga sp. M361]|uniref:cytochrome c biogenesis protein CcsA n=1 Tax=Fulvivirga sp. M361 TaxID=2594266 RepID=UPI00117A8C1B|nr:cytochrome c biogenesis protein CcsA [Fulvivirga sp. M361]TRX56182.1 cytochrome C biogenesis protein [Fulvivirga sp. M361]
MKKIWSFLFSNKITLVALLAFAVAMAYATFMENDFGTNVARQAIYEAWWFELLMAILALNFAGNIYRYRLLRKDKLSILLFHLAFIVVLIGAFVTRYSSYEGLVRIREGQSTNKIISQERYVKMQVHWDNQEWEFEKRTHLTRLNQPDIDLEAGKTNDPIRIRINRFVPDAIQGLVESEDENEVIELVAATGEGRSSFYLESGGSVFLNGHEVTFNNEKVNGINITGGNDRYLIHSPEDFNYLVMANQQSGRLTKDVTDTLRTRALYRSDHLSFVVNMIYKGKRLDYQTTENKELAQNAADLLFVDLMQGNTQKTVILAALNGVFSPMQETSLNDYDVKLSYGPRLTPLPFSLRLTDFQLERYPGSTSPSSYASELVVEDDERTFPVRISMNNVLDHKGYRFFQASYDLDELGTVLSVNKDFWGTQITYLGYILMGLGMLLTLFGKNSRFVQVSKKLNQLKLGTAVLISAMVIFPGLISANSLVAEEEPVLSTKMYMDKSHAAEFGRLMVQDMDGRIKPINTLASEFLRKLTRKTHYMLKEDGETYKLNSDQVFLSIHHDPLSWQYMPLIKVDVKKGKMILLQLGQEDKDMLSFQDLLDDNGEYRLRENVEAAQRKKPAERSELDNEVIKVDERFNVLFQALSGNYLKIFPQPGARDHKWFNTDFINAGFRKQDSVFVRNILGSYYQDIKSAKETGDWAKPQDKLLYLKTFQDTMGKEIIPTDGRIQAELLYNNFNVFNKLFPIYWMLGIYLLLLALLRVFFDKPLLKNTYLLGVILTGLAFALQTANMILRWYAGGYPPWSNGYEMIILVSWALFLFGFIFYRKSDFILPVVALFGGTLLFVSYLDWLNPEITNLVPVLKSYWLKIHVAIIVSSYAPLALSALLGLLSLIFMIFRNDNLKKPITELTYINELSMTIGLFMLAVGTFLGGVWANESWGRYWGWDPKETWALISIVIYAIVLHMRLIPKLRGEYTFSLASVVAFFSIIMTSFGVNYYLSGLHSYAAGDPVPVPQFVYWTVGSIFLIALASYIAKSQKALKL